MVHAQVHAQVVWCSLFTPRLFGQKMCTTHKQYTNKQIHLQTLQLVLYPQTRSAPTSAVGQRPACARSIAKCTRSRGSTTAPPPRRRTAASPTRSSETSHASSTRPTRGIWRASSTSAPSGSAPAPMRVGSSHWAWEPRFKIITNHTQTNHHQSRISPPQGSRMSPPQVAGRKIQDLA